MLPLKETLSVYSGHAPIPVYKNSQGLSRCRQKATLIRRNLSFLRGRHVLYDRFGVAGSADTSMISSSFTMQAIPPSTQLWSPAIIDSNTQHPLSSISASQVQHMTETFSKSSDSLSSFSSISETILSNSSTATSSHPALSSLSPFTPLTEILGNSSSLSEWLSAISRTSDSSLHYLSALTPALITSVVPHDFVVRMREVAFNLAVSLPSLPVDPWAPGAVDSQSIASSLFAVSLFPYLGFLYHLTRSKTAPKLTLFGFYFLLAFVAATIPAGIYAKVHYGTSLSNVDYLHGGAESLLSITNLCIVLGLRRALRTEEEATEGKAGYTAANEEAAGQVDREAERVEQR
eukprot:TRINITY_DN39182_c0_g1_i1.p1 TRINITY_DN39182_c0_g1~~TRINITY_DN39182_c0_g1_i1.p1  ORF type:complete len:347 (+),score=17.75 TRINITY_DN39182_c0_g1_i1:159-1199(+)